MSCQHPFLSFAFFFFYHTATTDIYTFSLHDALPISGIFPAIGFSSPFAPHRLPLLVQRGLAMPTTAHFRAVRQNRVANARVLAAARANDHHVGGVDAPFLLDDPALYVLRRVGTRDRKSTRLNSSHVEIS